MKLRKIMALMLAVLLLVGTLSGCSSLKEDTVVMTISGEEIDYATYSAWISYTKNVFETTVGTEVADWSALLTNGTTYADYIVQYAQHLMTTAYAVEINAAAQGIELTDADREKIKDTYDTAVLNYPSDAEFKAAMAANYGSLDLFYFLQENNAMFTRCFTTQFGENGEDISDEEAMTYADDMGYMGAKHILIKTVDDDKQPLSDSEIAKAKEKAEEILAQLDAYNGNDLEGYFDELMAKHSEDPGAETFPDGYVFTDGEMVDEFQDATREMDAGTYSDLVESSFGYHIIYRFELTPDSVPYAYASYGYTLRYMAASSAFDKVVRGWQENLEIEYTESFEKIDILDILTAA